MAVDGAESPRDVGGAALRAGPDDELAVTLSPLDRPGLDSLPVDVDDLNCAEGGLDRRVYAN